MSRTIGDSIELAGLAWRAKDLANAFTLEGNSPQATVAALLYAAIGVAAKAGCPRPELDSRFAAYADQIYRILPEALAAEASGKDLPS